MGREIVYCWKCATRLASADFEHRKAFRYQDKVSCEECVYDLVGDLPAEEQERILAGESAPPKKSSTGTIKKIEGGTSRRTGAVPRATSSVPRATGAVPHATGSVPKASGQTKRITRSIPKVEAPPPDEEAGELVEDPAAKKKKLLILTGAGGGGLVLLVVVLVLVLGGKKKPPAPVAAAEPAATRPVPKTPEKPEPSQAAKTALIEISQFEKSNPEATGELLKKWRELEQLAAGTEVAKDAAHSIELLLARLEKAAGALDETLKPHLASEDFKALFEGLSGEASKHEVPEWKAAIERKTAQYKSILADKWRSVKAKAEEARANEDKAALEALAVQVAKWGQADYLEEFGKIATAAPASEPAAKPAAPATPAAKPGKAPAAKPVFSKPLSPEMQSFLPGWQRAAGMAFNRDYDGAVAELAKAAKAVDSDEVRKAASEDGDLVRTAGEFLLGELARVAADVKRLSTIGVEYLHAPGTWKEISGRVTKVESSRLEFKIQTEDPKEKKVREEIRLVEFSDLSADTLGGMLKAKKKTLDKKESLHLAILCLLEGDLEAGRGYAAGQAVPERFLVWAGEARAAAPKAGGRELEARDLFHQHEMEWKKMETWGPAMEKAKTLVNEFSTSRIVRANQALLTKRMGEGRETIFLPTMLKATGDSNTFRFMKDELFWVTTKDIDFNDSLHNYVDAEFYALANTSYRAWIYVAGCCQPVFGALYQTTEGEITHKGKTVAINPGDNVAPPIPLASNLKKTHDDHKPKGAKEHPKTPARWAWVSLPLPKQYASPGPKTIRLLTDQAGFAVKYVVVSSTRTTLPDAAALKDLDAQAAAALAAAPAVGGPKGAPQPKDWLVIGPFEPKLAQAEEVESNIDPKKEVKGKGKGNVKWKPFAATVAGANATLDWTKSKIYNSPDNTSAYALIHVKSPESMDAQLVLTHDDGGRAWVNGTRVHDNDRGGGFKKDEFKARIRLEEGWNRLLFKVRNGTGGFGLQMRVVDGAGEPIGSLEWHPYGDALDP
jgi:hypothetical protein